jgi:beta-glucosidase
MMACLNRIGMSWGHYGLLNNILREEWGFEGYLITDGVGPGFVDLYNPPSLCLASNVAMLTRDDRVDEDTYTVVEGTGATDTLYGQYMLRENMHRLFYQMVATGNDAGSSAALNAESSDNTMWKIGWAALDIILAAAVILIYVFGVHKQLTLAVLKKRNGKE